MATKVTGSVAFTPKRRLARTRVRPNAPARPTPMPMSASVSAQIYVPHAQDSHWNFIAAMSSKCRPDAWPRSRYRIARNAIRDSRIATSANKRAASRAEARLSTAGITTSMRAAPSDFEVRRLLRKTARHRRERAPGTGSMLVPSLQRYQACPLSKPGIDLCTPDFRSRSVRY